jgi:hypothetical protein
LTAADFVKKEKGEKNEKTKQICFFTAGIEARRAAIAEKLFAV